MRWFKVIALVVLAGSTGVVSAATTNALDWRVAENKVSADIKGWDVQTLLEHIATATGWQIFLEPETKEAISAKFKDRSPGDALRLLIPNLTAALVPETNAPSKLYVYKTSQQQATQRIASHTKRKSANPIANELIVKLKPGEKIDDLAKRLGAKVIGRIDGLNAYRLRFEDADATNSAREALAGDSSVESVDNNYAVMRPPEPQPLGVSSGPPMNLYPKAAASGDQIIIGLIDTAVQKEGNPNADFLLPGISVATSTAEATTQPRHGDSMFQTILQGMSLAENGDGGSRARVLAVDIYGGSDMTSTFEISAGIFRAVESGAKIINLSLGSSAETPFLKTLIESSSSQGVLFFGAAGNEPVTTPTYPAAYPDVIAVTALNRSGQIAPWANFGSFVDVGAPGSSIISFGNAAYMVTGTSASTAFASGAAAGFSQSTGKTGNGLQALVLQSLAIPGKK
ncbi:MAG: S8 family serine peptidase [Verrucomicrobia subdivision 3 bacterium]|nr:S8 family serine peptidase [Limisphaerales bacterium]